MCNIRTVTNFFAFLKHIINFTFNLEFSIKKMLQMIVLYENSGCKLFVVFLTDLEVQKNKLFLTF